MTDVNITFCRTLLRSVHADVKAARPDINLRSRNYWVWNFMRDDWEFHGPEGFYWHGSADNAYDARAKGWSAWLNQSALEAVR